MSYSPLGTFQLRVTAWPGPPDDVAVKLLIVGFGPVGTFCGVYSGEISTTSKSDAVTECRLPRSSLFQRKSGVPVINIDEPLSAMIIPYCFRAVRITWLCGEKPEMSRLAFSRSRMPMGAA